MMGTGVMDQWLRAWITLLEDPDKSHHPHGGSQSSETPVSENFMFFSGLCWHEPHLWYIDMHAKKSSISIKY